MSQPVRLRIVLLEGSVFHIRDPRCKELFNKLVGLKLMGYGAEYQYGVLPSDSTDFIGTHLIICEEKENGELIPLAGYRSINLKQCDIFRLPFPPLVIAQTSQAPEHEKYLLNLIEEARRTGQNVRYCSSYTIDPKTRENRVLTQKLKNIICGMQVHFLRESSTHVSLVCGAVKFKVDKMFAVMGYEGIRSAEGQTLPTFFQHSLFGAEALMMRMGQFSEQCLAWAAECKELWDNRIHLVPPQDAPKAWEPFVKRAA